ncbi:MAG TPA: hypothetical protein VGI87_02525 [Solirubrobacteraceae bacterium]|jgi:MYXO-CTERM domain-containing protein
MASRFATALVALLLSATLFPAAAAADGDPASDVLLGENVFYPYSPPTARSLETTLNAETAAAKKAGFPLKVAIIGSPVDLGVIPDLFGKPQQYATFLDQEISFHTKQALLVVMTAGYGSQGLSPAATSAVASLPKPGGKASDDLAQAAITAVSKLAAASGHPVKGVKGVSSSSSGGSSSTTTILIAVLALAALGTATALVVVRRRQAAATK